MRGATRAGALVINPEVAESDLTRLPLDQLRGRFEGAEVEVSSDAAKWTSSAFSASGRRALEGIFLVLGLLLLAAEAVVTRALRVNVRVRPA